MATTNICQIYNACSELVFVCQLKLNILEKVAENNSKTQCDC